MDVSVKDEIEVVLGCSQLGALKTTTTCVVKPTTSERKANQTSISNNSTTSKSNRIIFISWISSYSSFSYEHHITDEKKGIRKQAQR